MTSRLLRYAAIALAALSLIVYLPIHLYLLSLLQNLRWQYLVVAILFIIVGLVRRQWVVTGASVVALLLNAFAVINFLPLSFNDMHEGVEPHRATFYVANIHRASADVDRIIESITAADPDVFALLETDARVVAAIEAHFEAAYPYGISYPNESNFGLMMRSRLPLQSAEIVTVSDGSNAAIDATLEGDRLLRCLFVHPYPPVSRAAYNARNRRLRGLATELSQTPHAYLMAGDFNASPYEPIYAEVLEYGRLRDHESGDLKWRSTWKSRIPLFGLELDHLLLGGQADYERYRIGDDIGSDHYPLIADVAW